ncbi:hypothetical protein PHLCEN_2v4683 [Hermanssonia centrifuga]|uniref:Ribosome maturation protein SDO1/SBDS N-terminal domain-containing protein n=1 Tax=Hermanssonia centrifuga TaxID=98765 RepID=A0A2R6PMZ7_9APHY|nr:hypothetical protein PHLCEN_2v4683 [Hermanssonia centrifuga]
MTKALTKVIYKPSTQSSEEFTVIVNLEEYKKWKEGAFDVFHSTQGAQGILGKASNQQLDNIFGTHKDVDVVQQLLQKGTPQQSDGIRSSDFGGTNISIGSFGVDTKGKGLRGL